MSPASRGLLGYGKRHFRTNFLIPLLFAKRAEQCETSTERFALIKGNFYV